MCKHVSNNSFLASLSIVYEATELSVEIFRLKSLKSRVPGINFQKLSSFTWFIFYENNHVKLPKILKIQFLVLYVFYHSNAKTNYDEMWLFMKLNKCYNLSEKRMGLC